MKVIYNKIVKDAVSKYTKNVEIRKEERMIRKCRKSIILRIMIMALVLTQIGCAMKKEEIGLFSWSFSRAFEEKEKLFEMMKEMGVHSLYQEFPEDTPQEVIVDFLKLANMYKINVYYLAGAPEWGIEKSSGKMMTYIEHIITLNESFPERIGFKGIILDVEPYLTDEWDKDQEGVMNQYVKIMEKAYKIITENHLEGLICIPYFYDSLGYEKQLETLVQNGCDTIAVMNYYKEKEQEHIVKEMELAHQYSKKIIQIYELKAPGTHGLTEKSTYYHEGLQPILKSWESLKGFFNYKLFSFALHDYEALKEVVNIE